MTRLVICEAEDGRAAGSVAAICDVVLVAVAGQVGGAKVAEPEKTPRVVFAVASAATALAGIIVCFATGGSQPGRGSRESKHKGAIRGVQDRIKGRCFCYKWSLPGKPPCSVRCGGRSRLGYPSIAKPGTSGRGQLRCANKYVPASHILPRRRTDRLEPEGGTPLKINGGKGEGNHAG